MGALVFVLTLGLTSGALAVLHALDADPARAVELAVLVARERLRDRHPLRRAAHLGVRPPRRAGALQPRSPPSPRVGLASPRSSRRPKGSRMSTHPSPARDRCAPPARVGALDRPRAARPELVALLLLAAVLNLWALGRNGFANEYYSAAVRSMSTSWHAFLFGSFDAAGVMTVDKPPLALWVQALSARVFGF